MLCAVIKGPSLKAVLQELKEVSERADLIELRIDCLEDASDPTLKKILASSSLPLLFTLRTKPQGGIFEGRLEIYLAEIERLIALNPAYIDIESHVPPFFVEKLHSAFKETKIIISHHDFHHTPENMDSLFSQLRKFPADFYKIATQANDSIDALRLLAFTKKEKVIAMGMGNRGLITRILAPIMGPSICFAPLHLHPENSLGQASLDTLINTYRFPSLSAETDIYGLIGDPIEPSISHVTHNQVMEVAGLKSVYVKIQILPDQLGIFFKFALSLPFKGFSVTMPLKEVIVDYLDDFSSEVESIGAANTITLEEGKLIGHNTDGIGALNAIERRFSVSGRKVALIGAGGAAKAIAYEAKKRGAHVIIFTRSPQRVEKFACRIGCQMDEVGKIGEYGYDVLINCTPHPLPIQPDLILREALLMDLQVRPQETLFLKHAREKGAKIVFGYEMFIEQAAQQFSLWFNGIDIKKILETLKAGADNILAESLTEKAKAEAHQNSISVQSRLRPI